MHLKLVNYSFKEFFAYAWVESSATLVNFRAQELEVQLVEQL